ncbi:MAG: ribonuclease Z [Spirochaetes bacterium]|nr:MAG: ribonuclease Z [Spirochaetota bacterium]
MNLEVFILGCGGMMPLPGRYLTSVLLRREGEIFLFDCGEGTQVSLKELNLRWKKITAILISHTHADHVTGIPGMLMLSSQVEREEPLFIIGPPRIKEYIQVNRRVLDMYINYEIVVKEITSPGVVFSGDGFVIKSFFVKHSKPCVGYSLEEDPRPGVFYPEKAIQLGVPRGPLWSSLQSGFEVKLEDGRSITSEMVMGPPRRGRKVSFITDTTYSPEIAGEVTESDLLICEGMFTEELQESANEKKHLTAKQAAQIARDAGGVGKLGLIHYSPRYSERELKKLLKEAREIFPETFLSRDGQIIPVPNID